MKLTVFQSDKGDCLLLSSNGSRVLIDGGMSNSFLSHVVPALSQLEQDNKALDVVYLSHIDQDHIQGILELIQIHIDWAVCDYQRSNGNPGFPEPDQPRMPQIGGIWHNSFSDQLDENAGPISNMLAAKAQILGLSSLPQARDLAQHHRELAASVRQAITLRQRISGDLLGIPVNEQAAGRLMLRGDGGNAIIDLSGVRFEILGPSEKDLEKLRKEWNKWLKKNTGALSDLHDELRRDADDMGLSETVPLGQLATALVDRLAQDELALAEQAGLELKALGKRSKVTTPNLASLMFLAVENGAGGDKSLILTGDGHHQDILEGLKELNRLRTDGSIHVDILKVQHHGSEHNIDEEFCRLVTADNYVFCGNGMHENPDLDVVQALLDSRLGTPEQKSSNPEVNNEFHLWFNSHDSVVEDSEASEHMQKVEQLVTSAANSHPGAFQFSFLTDSSFDLEV